MGLSALTRGLCGAAHPWRVRAGGEWEQADHRSIGTLPEVGGDFGGIRGLRLWDSRILRWRSGAYLEVERRFGTWQINLGARADSYGSPDATSFEPRLAVGYRLSEHQRLRLAAGLYRQAPAAEYLERSDLLSPATRRPRRSALHDLEVPHHVPGGRDGRCSAVGG